MATARVGDLDMVFDVAGVGEPVLMINGIGAPRAGWGMQVPALSREFRIITCDNRDVGETGPGSAPKPYAMRQFADDAIGLLDHLGIERAHIVGASMGGCIAQEIAINYPERTRSTTVICSWPTVEPWLRELWDQWEDVFRHQGAIAWARTSWLWVFTHRWYAQPGNLEAMLEGAAGDPHPQTLEMNLRQSGAAKTFEAVDRLPGVRVPMHVIAGAEDIFTPPRYSEQIAALVPGSRLSIMEHVGHGMFWEATDAFNELVAGFIREHRQEGR